VPSLPEPAPRSPVAAALFAMLLAIVAGGKFADPDMYHEMALVREALELGRLPLEDRFAYTPTVTPSVHHEWGTGAVLYFLTARAGELGVLALSFAVAALALGLALASARRRGASWPVLGSVAPVGLLLLSAGTTTFRAQLFTLAATAGLLLALDLDRGGARWRVWLAVLLGYALWLNLHGGFVVALALVALDAFERASRRERWRHLALVAASMLALVALNPYGWRYYAYLGTALSMDRPLITEWRPIWRADAVPVALVAFAALVAAYAVLRGRARDARGWPILLATAVATVQHERHASLFGVAWLAYVPSLVQRTPLGAAMQRFWERRPRANWAVWGGATLLALAVALSHGPARLPVPANPGDHELLLYPAGAVEHLRERGFRGNLMTPFTVGAYVSWHLHPDVKVSIDGRYEVAYAPGVLERIHAFYEAAPGWRSVLDDYPSDAVLARTASRIQRELELAGWPVAYVDDAYALHMPPSWNGSVVDRRGERLEARFP
jgi:hypothetical protein